MSFLFKKPTAPVAQAVPASPGASAEAERQRQEAEAAAVAEAKAAGRRSTIVAGAQIAADEQYNRGLLAQSKRRAAQEMVG